MRIIVFFIVFSLLGNWSEELAKGERDQLLLGKFIIHRKDVKFSKWPEMTLYKLLKGVKASDAAALFSDYNSHKSFVPSMVKSKIVREVAKNIHEVAFEIRLPWPVSNAVYTSSNKIEKKGEDYLIKWKQIKSNQTKDSWGEIKFSPLKESTLVIYRNAVVPDTVFARLLKKTAEKDVVTKFKAMMSYIEENGTKKSILVEKRLLLRKKLGN